MKVHGPLDFIVPHDGSQVEVAPTEEVVVGQRFSALTQRLLEGQRLQPSSRRDFDRLRLRLPFSETNYLTIDVITNVDNVMAKLFQEPSKIPVEAINLKHVVEGKSHGTVSYQLCVDGAVRRIDAGDEWVNKQADIDAELSHYESLLEGTDMADETVNQRVDTIFLDALEDWRNRLLETQMGFRYQSIDTAEFEALETLVTQPGVTLRG